MCHGIKGKGEADLAVRCNSKARWSRNITTDVMERALARRMILR